MRIAYLVSKYPAISHTFILREVLGLRRLGWEVETVSIRRASAAELLTEVDRAEAQRTKVVMPAGVKGGAELLAACLWAVGRPLRLWRAMKAAWGLHRAGVRGTIWAMFYLVEAILVGRWCARRQMGHIHAHFANVASDVGLLAGVLLDKTFSFTMHGPTEFFDVQEHRLAEKARAAAFVICISDFARGQLMSLLPPDDWEKLEVVHCGVEVEQTLPRTPAAAKGQRLLCVARLAPVKGHAILLQALGQLRARDCDVSLTLAGDGPMRAALEKLAGDLGIRPHVQFLGNVGQDRMRELYAAADVFVLPSFAEGVPVVLMEAMAAGCPVVATRIAGIPELIEHGTTGLLVPPGRADLLAEAVERVLLNRSATRRMAQRAREKVGRDFNIALAARQLSAIFRQRVQPAATLRPVGAERPDVRRRATEAERERSPGRGQREDVSSSRGMV